MATLLLLPPNKMPLNLNPIIIVKIGRVVMLVLLETLITLFICVIFLCFINSGAVEATTTIMLFSSLT